MAEEESIASEVLSASLGGAISASILYPLEVLKTQMQASRDGDAKQSSMVAFAKVLYARDPTVFVRGVEMSGFQSALEKALYFLAYTAFKRSYLNITNQPHLSTLPNLVMGCAAEWAHLPLTLPVDAWTTKIQTSNEAPLTILLHMLNDPDCRFYSGITAYSLLCLKPALQYTAYEQVKAIIVQSRQSKSLSAAEAFLLGMIARTISTILVFPFLRAKVLLQVSKNQGVTTTDDDSEKEKTERGVLLLVWQVWRQGGAKGLYQGLGPELTRGVFSSALMLMIKERIAVIAKQLLQSYKHSQRKKPPSCA
jgi:solute carrier family 25 (peroxisomal adenine nucleotide transporter), member 17